MDTIRICYQNGETKNFLAELGVNVPRKGEYLTLEDEKWPYLVRDVERRFRKDAAKLIEYGRVVWVEPITVDL